VKRADLEDRMSALALAAVQAERAHEPSGELRAEWRALKVQLDAADATAAELDALVNPPSAAFGLHVVRDDV